MAATSPYPMNHAKVSVESSRLAPRSTFYQGPFGRLFRNLPPWTPEGASELEQLEAIASLAESLFEAADAGPEHDNPNIPAGYTYLGQFVDHDITFDTTSSLQRLNDPDRIENFRTPRFDLDNIYGRGPTDQPYLYSRADPRRLLTSTTASGEADLPRNSDETALIGDPRNDENIIISQLQLAILQLHNRFIDDGETFDEARRLTRWHYQWVVIHDFLVRLCGNDRQYVEGLLDSARPGRPNLQFYGYKHRPFIPVEFSAAAYRLGHSMVRPSYHLNHKLRDDRGDQPIAIFGNGDADSHLAGGRILPDLFTVQWDFFVDHAGSVPQRSRLIDLKLSPPLMHLPLGESDPRFNSLPFRNILRGWRLELPAGQDVSRRMNIDPIDADERDPLWVYILKEAEQKGNGGRHLGPVGRTIVAEVFVGLLAGDPHSYYAMDPTWKPEAGASFDFADLLALAGVPLDASDIDDLTAT